MDTNAAEYCTDHSGMTKAAMSAREACIGQALAKQLVEGVNLASLGVSGDTGAKNAPQVAGAVRQV